jgi:hypothetical protein
MVTTSFNATQITPPRVPIIDDRTGLVSREWYRYFYSLYAFTGSGTGILPIPSGGTGLGTLPTNGQLLIGDTASSSYKLHVIDTGAGIAITNGSGTILITNTGVLSNIAGSGIAVSNATGNVTVSNTGVLSAIAGSGISVSSATGNITFANTGVLSFSGGSTGLLPLSATTGAVSLSGTLGVGYGGTGQTTYTNGQLLIGNTTGNTLTKTTLTAGSGVSISNGAGSITISATGSGGTVTAVTGTAPVVSSGGTTPAISMPKATTSVDGYLSSTDWTTFNNKGSGTVTSVTATSPVASTGGTTPVISMPAATTSVSGYLTSTDWNTFNGKQPAGTYVTAVSGTAPVVSSGGTTPAISMAAATTSVSGYLTSTDWNTFNSKQPAGTYVTSITVTSSNGLAGTVTSGATPAITLSTSITGILKGNGTAISAATSGTDYAPATSGTSILYGNGAGGFSNVTIGTGVSFAGGTLSATGSGGTVTSVTGTAPVVSSGGATPAISMAAATASVNGYLTSTDWTTFNNKGSGSVTSVGGTGTVNGITLTGTVTSSGNLTLGGTLSGVSLTTQVSGTLPTANGGTNLTSFTSSGVVYASSTSALATGSALTFDGTNFATTGSASAKSFIPTSSTVPTNGMYLQAANKVAFSTNSTFAYLIDSTQSFCIGDTGNFGAKMNLVFDPSSTNGLLFAVSSGTFNKDYVYFQNSGGSKIGSIASNNSIVIYNTTSDYRIKTNVQPITGALAKVAQLNPVTYDWTPDFAEGGSQGFIAHELQAIVPDCVTGQKDELDENGKPKYQGVDTSFLVATLTAAIQEQQALIKQLQIDVATLKGV